MNNQINIRSISANLHTKGTRKEIFAKLFERTLFRINFCVNIFYFPSIYLQVNLIFYCASVLIQIYGVLDPDLGAH